MVVVLLCLGCGKTQPSVSWTIRFKDPTDKASARWVEATIAQGSCDAPGAVYFSDTADMNATGTFKSPPNLAAGSYAISARAKTADCVWFASGCVNVTLPSSENFDVVLNRTPDQAECAGNVCSNGLCSNGVSDGGQVQSGMTDQDASAQVDATQDAAPDAGGMVTCDPDTCPGRRCVSNACAHYASCGELHTQRPTVPSGVYEFKPTPGGPVSPALGMYCEMNIDGGGWTLVARSVSNWASSHPSDVSSFGWQYSRGSPSDDSGPYSLGPSTISGFVFSDVLLTTYTSGKVIGPEAFKIHVPSNFISAYDMAAYDTTGQVTPIGTNATCSIVPAMMHYLGWTYHDTSFYSKDTSSNSSAQGLSVSKYTLDAVSCSASGKLDEQIGLIFVR